MANDWLRSGMSVGRSSPRPRYEPTVHDTGAPKRDVTDIAAVLDELDS